MPNFKFANFLILFSFIIALEGCTILMANEGCRRQSLLKPGVPGPTAA